MSVKIENTSKWLNYHHLYYFSIIAKEGSIARAAERLRLGQPTLSAQLKQFEESLNKKLFDRTKKRLTLTEAGRLALEYADEVFKLGSEMVEALEDRLGPQKIHLQIGALDSVPKTVVRDLIQLALKSEKCTVSVLEGKSDELIRELSAHKIDLIISNHALSSNQGLDLFAKSIGRSELIVCAHKSFLNCKKNYPHSLNNKPFVLPTQHSKLRSDIEHFFKLNDIRPDIVAETQDTSIQRLLGQTGAGLIPLSRVSAQDLISEKKLIEIGVVKGVFEELWLIAGKRKVENPIAAKLYKSFVL